MYLPSNDRTCCPNIAIRLDATKFSASSSQRKVLRRFRSYARGARGSGASGTGGQRGKQRGNTHGVGARDAADDAAVAQVARCRAALLPAVRAARVTTASDGSAVVVKDVPGWSDDAFAVRVGGTMPEARAWPACVE